MTKLSTVADLIWVDKKGRFCNSHRPRSLTAGARRRKIQISDKSRSFRRLPEADVVPGDVMSGEIIGRGGMTSSGGDIALWRSGGRLKFVKHLEASRVWRPVTLSVDEIIRGMTSCNVIAPSWRISKILEVRPVRWNYHGDDIMWHDAISVWAF